MGHSTSTCSHLTEPAIERPSMCI
uniref:Uncharacterized protein n=1 Tax=Anguilla anguilla TaxID=7936 RepID=A0A0E9VS80_ANGAN